MEKLSRRGARAWFVPGAFAVVLALQGCAAWPDWRNGSPQHEHNAFCGHSYLQDMYPNPCPRDFAGSDAWRGPLYENDVRWHDPWKCDLPAPERPMPWTVPGNGNPADRTLPGRAAPHDTNRVPEKSAGEDPRGVPHWPLEAGTPKTD